MNEAETEFLALAAIGMFRIKKDGRITRLKEWTKGSRNGSAPSLETLRKPRFADVSLSGQGHGHTQYRRVMFVSKGKRHTIHAHRVIWMMANGSPIADGLQINHKDGNGLNNELSNLELATNAENITHAIRVLGRKRKSRPGSLNPTAKLTERQAAEIKRLAALRSMPQRKIAELFGVDQQTVSNIHVGKTWKHVLAG